MGTSFLYAKFARFFFDNLFGRIPFFLIMNISSQLHNKTNK